MSHIVIDDVFVMRRPSPGGSEPRGIRPKAREKKLSATAQRSARIVSRVRLRTRSADARR
jgi:hypothetical protein